MAIWEAASGGASGYRMAGVVRASVSKSLTVVGTVEPVSNASAAFQVAGKVATVTAAVGQQVTAGQSLATLDTTALSETVSSAQSSLSSADAKLTEDEDSQSSATSSTSAARTASTTTTTTPGASSGTSAATITQDQNTLTTDQAQTSSDQQQEAADLAQATVACEGGSGSPGSPTMSTTTSTTAPNNNSTTACSNALQEVSSDQRVVSNDQAAVAKDEATLAKALGDSSSPSSTSSPGGGGTGSTSPGGGVGSHALSLGNTGSGATPSSSSSSPSSSESPSASGGSSAASDTPQQIASDQASIDSANANLIEAQQALADAQLTSPINGTIVSVGLAVGDTVSAGSSTEVIVIIGTQSFQVAGTLTSSQVAELKVGDTAQVAVDGLDSAAKGTVSQVGPVQSGTSGYSYPVVVALPSSVQGLFSGSTANLTIGTGQVVDVIAVPTSAVITAGSISYVQMLKNGTLTRKIVKLGMIGGIYSQVNSGLSPGQSVVLANLAEAVPSSNTASLGGIGGGLGGGGFGGFTGGGGGRFRGGVTISPGGGGATNSFSVGG